MGHPIAFAVERSGQPLTISVIPQLLPNEKTPRIGIAWDTSGRMIAHPRPIEQIYNSITSTLNTIGAVASPKSDVKLQHLSGPLGIFRIYYLLFENERGWTWDFWFQRDPERQSCDLTCCRFPSSTAAALCSRWSRRCGASR